jgi:hypothetical protein
MPTLSFMIGGDSTMPASFSIYFDDTLRRKLALAAADLGISKGELVRRATLAMLEKQASENPALAALV